MNRIFTVKRAAALLLSVILLLSAAMLTACGAAKENHQAEHSEFVKSEDFPFLYEVTYHDYDWNDVTAYLEGPVENAATDGAFGCSGVHSGSFFGRSFDYYLLDKPEFLLRTEHENGHFASIGITYGDCSLDEQRIRSINAGDKTEKDILDEKLLPFAMIDGMNENGVVCSGNVVPSHDLAPHEGEEMYITHGTDPGKEDLHYQFLIRYVLDNAESARHAVELLQNRNITGLNSAGEMRDYFGLGSMGYELHYMIADKDDTYVVELVNDRMSVVAGDVMTNFYLSCLTPGSAGLERYRILYDNYQNVHSADDMKALLGQVRYSNTYRTDGEGQDSAYWPTEMSDADLPYTYAEQWSRENWDYLKSVLDSQNELIRSGTRSPAGGAGVPWITVHAEVFDIETKTMHLCTQENYDEWVEFRIG